MCTDILSLPNRLSLSLPFLSPNHIFETSGLEGEKKKLSSLFTQMGNNDHALTAKKADSSKFLSSPFSLSPRPPYRTHFLMVCSKHLIVIVEQ